MTGIAFEMKDPFILGEGVGGGERGGWRGRREEEMGSEKVTHTERAIVANP